MIEKSVIEQITEEFLKDSACFPVKIEVKPENLIVVEIDSDKAVSIEDCTALSRYIESRLDRDTEDYELEVGSFGITQPFKLVRQYQKNIGKDVETVLKNGKKYTGVLDAADDNQMAIKVERLEKPEGAKRKIKVEETLSFPYDEIKYTKNIIRFK